MNSDNPPAKPKIELQVNIGPMSLRDYFAASAGAAMLSNGLREFLREENGEKHPDKLLSEMAYEFADAMLKERAK